MTERAFCFILFGIAAEHTPHYQEFSGLIPARYWAYFIFFFFLSYNYILYQWCVLEKVTRGDSTVLIIRTNKWLLSCKTIDIVVYTYRVHATA